MDESIVDSSDEQLLESWTGKGFSTPEDLCLTSNGLRAHLSSLMDNCTMGGLRISWNSGLGVVTVVSGVGGGLGMTGGGDGGTDNLVDGVENGRGLALLCVEVPLVCGGSFKNLDGLCGILGES